jgi:hypothetical protein
LTKDAERKRLKHSTAQHSTAQHSTAQHSTARLNSAFLYAINIERQLKTWNRIMEDYPVPGLSAFVSTRSKKKKLEGETI